MKKTMILTALAALSATLCAETPAELEKTFDEAVKSGRPLTAERMFTQLLEKGGKLAPTAPFLQRCKTSYIAASYVFENACYSVHCSCSPF